MKTGGHVKIIIPCTNEGEWLRVTVDSILEHTDYPSFEVVVSANGDRVTDFSFIDDPAYRQVELLWTERALGVGNARNVAARPGDATFYVFLDSHCLVDDRDWLRRAVDCLDRHPEASMVQPEVVGFVFEGEIEPSRKLEVSRMPLQNLESCARWAWPYEEPSYLVEPLGLKGRAGEPFEAMAGGEVAGFVRAKTFHRLGRFDPEVDGWFHATMDYCVRSWLLGCPVLVEPGVRLYHRGPAERPDFAPRALHLIHGLLRTAYKYLSPRRRDLAEILFRRHGITFEVDVALDLVRRGNWLPERVRHLRERVHDDDWLFSKFEVYEERFCGQIVGSSGRPLSSARSR